MSTAPGGLLERFEHTALFYADEAEFVDGTLPFVAEGIALGEPVLVACSRERTSVLRSLLGSAADHVSFMDMAEVGVNPARIIPVWREFVSSAPTGASCRGIGEPLWPGRSEPERVECHLHEHLLNVAFHDARGFRLLCPYDARALDASDIAHARRSHPYLRSNGSRHGSVDYEGSGGLDAFRRALGDLPDAPHELVVKRATSLAPLRRYVRRLARDAGLDDPDVHAVVLAVDELVANSLRYGGGRAVVGIWPQPGSLVCEVRDRGRIGDPLVGRVRPPALADGGRGLWIVNQMCDLVELRSSDVGTVVRVRVGSREAAP